MQAQRVVKAVDIVFVQPFQRLILQVLGELVKALDSEQSEQPLVENQLSVERQ
jgi:hypothetical protein